MAITINQLMQNEYFLALLILAISIIVAKITLFILRNYAHKITVRTKSDLDDKLVEASSKPIYLLIIAAGLYFAADRISAVDPYAESMNILFSAIFVFSGAYLIAKILSVFVNHSLKVQKKYEKTPQLINKIVAVVVFIVAGLILLSHYNVEVTPIIATLGLGSIGIGLALQDTISNFFAGLHILTDKPINVGDIVEIDSPLSETGTLRGEVVDIGWRSTRIRIWNNDIVIVPNAKLASNILINRTMPTNQHVFNVNCGVSYQSDLKKVEKITLEVANKVQKTSEFAQKDYEPLFRYKEFGDSNINF
ncbi:MAG: mechanosensitive ion channel family protein, partial [Candidatus Micrarchaeia archaeon]